MKLNRKSFGMKLWLWFVLFAAMIFAALWLLQTVFLQNFYDGMAIHNVERVAGEIAGQQDNGNLEDVLADYAANESLLIFLTDWDGNILYSADEHNSVYREHRNRTDAAGNPYREFQELMNWQIGAFRILPSGYADFLQQLSASESGTIGYRAESGDAYVYGMALAPSEQWGAQGAVLYISMPLGAVGAATSILRIQLIWVTAASLIISFFIAYWISRQFARPIASIAGQAERMADGEFCSDYKRGFCLELDELSDTLSTVAASLKRLENARRELLANVSHDLRTPLTMIKGYAEMVREISWSDDAMREQDLSIIIREADRLTGLVNDILDYSAQSAERPVEDVDFDLSAAARSVAEQFAPLCEHKSCTLETAIQPDQWVHGEEAQIKRVLYNLIDNAICHAGENRIVRVSLTGSAARVRAEVQDNGQGIPEEELPYIWDRYFTAKERRQSGGRSGLGLAITKEILKRQHADFGVESACGKGSRFWFEMERQNPGKI